MKVYEVTVQYDRETAATFLFFLKKVYGKKNTYKVKTIWMECTRWIKDRATYTADTLYEVIRLWLEEHEEVQNGSILKFQEVKI